MRYGIHFSYWADRWAVDYRPYIEKAAELGFDLLEVSCSGIFSLFSSQVQLQSLKQCAADHGIGLTAGYCPSTVQNLCSEDSEVVERQLAFFASFFPKLQMLGIHTLGGPLYSRGEMHGQKQIDKAGDRGRAVENFRKASEIAEQWDVVLGLEVVNRYEGYLLNTCREAVSFVEDIGSSHVKVMLDTFHMNIEEDSIPGAIREAGKHLGHLHVSEQNRRVPGQGTLPWEQIGYALKDISYDGAVVMEPFPRSRGEIGHKVMLWRDVVDNATDAQLDKDAKQSLDFLRRTWADGFHYR